MHWIDITSYARDEKTKDGLSPKPRTWQHSIGGYLRVVVLKDHISFPGKWVMHLHPLFTEYDLDLPDVAPAEQAQERAAQVVRDVLKACAMDLK